MSIAETYNRVAGTLVDHVENKRTDQAAGVMRLPVSSYLDEGEWRREMDLIFARLPLFACMSSAIATPGSYWSFNYLGKPVVVTRLADGSVRAMLNVCAHRGMVLTPEGQGRCARFSCPYHGWTYKNDGTLIGIADRAKFGDVDEAPLNLTQLPVHEQAGMVFLVLTPGLDVDFSAFFAGMLDEIEHYRFQDWHFAGTRDIHGANWKVAYDGYLEGYHFAAAHPETIHKRTYSNVMQFEPFGPHLRIGFAQLTLLERLKAKPETDWWQFENDGYDFVRTLFPNVSIFVAPELTQIAQLMPGPTPGENRTVLHFVTRKSPATDEERAASEGVMDWLKEVVEVEDYGVGLKVQQGMESGAFKEVTLGRNEQGNQYFHRWVRHYTHPDDEPYPPVL